MALSSVLLFASGCSSTENVMAASDPSLSTIEQASQKLGRGINLGNMLEAPKEGEWGVRLEAEYFKTIKEAGFDSVRLPCKWSVHALKEAPYTLDETFAKRVDWALDQAEKHGLNLVLNVHHYDEFAKDPDNHVDRLVAIWRQLAERYKGRGGFLYFELFNEPHGDFTPAKWNAVIPKLMAEVRKTNPTRPVIIGPGNWNGIGGLKELVLPSDPNIIVTVHFYEPFEFTHQGAEWVPQAAAWKDVRWTGSEEQKKAIRSRFDEAKAFGKPIYVGEFGAYSKADAPSRKLWTRFVVEEMNARGFSWAYWEFCSGFGAYDAAKKEWRTDLLDGLMAGK